MNPPCVIALLAVVFLGANIHAQHSAYLPPPGTLLVTPSYLFTTFDNSWFGTTKAGHPSVEQHTALLNAEYGLSDAWAADVSLGYVSSSADFPFGRISLNGLADTRIGARHRVFDEETIILNYIPTVTFRIGAIIEGTYNDRVPLVPMPMLPGNGASGGEVSILLGRQIGESGWGLYSDLGARVFSEGVPPQLTASFGGYGTVFDVVTVGLGWRHQSAFSGPDLSSAGFVPSDVRKASENWHRVESTITFADKHGTLYQVYLGYAFNGRNTGEEMSAGIAVTIPFKLRRPEPATLP